MQTGAGKNITNQEVEKEYVPVIIDTLGVELLPFVTYGKERIHSSYLYFGPRKDTILVGGIFKGPMLNLYDIEMFKNQKLYPDQDIYPFDPNYSFGNGYKKGFQSNVLSIVVDTTCYVSKPLGYYSKGFKKGRPVLITTKSSVDSIVIGLGYYLDIQIQAKDSVGRWCEIEDYLMYECGYGMEGIVLPPKYVIVSSVYVYDGDFQTELRLKLGGNYSNTFTGKINYGQFDNNGKSYFYSPPPPAPMEK